MELQIDTSPLLRPKQLADAQEERDSLDKKLKSPHIQDKGEIAKQIRRLDASLSKQTPRPFEGVEKDAAIKLEAKLREDILQGMPSQEEMRKAPPGAVDKHMTWERKNKEAMLQWKNLQLRLNVGNGDTSVANFERYRPKDSSLNMDNAAIQGKQYFMPPFGASRGVAFTEAELAELKAVSPSIAEKLGLFTNDQRAEIKSALQSKKG